MFKTEEALAMIGGHVDEILLLRYEHLAIENNIPVVERLNKKTNISDMVENIHICFNYKLPEMYNTLLCIHLSVYY